MKISNFNININDKTEIKNKKHSAAAAPCGCLKKDVFFRGRDTNQLYLKYDFVKKSDVAFFNEITKIYPNISQKSILDKLAKISQKEKLEGHNKLNLVEHVITKETRGETRDYDKLMSYIDYFSKNEKLNSVLIADSSKYALEVPSIDISSFDSVLSYIIDFANFKNAASVMKIAKLINLSSDRKQMLCNLVKDGFNPPQIKVVATMSDELMNNLAVKKSVSELKTEEKFELFQLLNTLNDKVFDEKMNKLFPLIPPSVEAAEHLKKTLQHSFFSDSPLIIDDISRLKKIPKNLLFNNDDNLVLNICNSVLKNNKPQKGQNCVRFFEQKAFQSISELEKYNLSYEQRNKICKILRTTGELLDSQIEFSPELAALNLRFKNSFLIFKTLFGDKKYSPKINAIERYITFLKNNTHTLIQNDFDSENFQIKCFKDGTINKIVEYNTKNKKNPMVMLHSCGAEILGLIPNKNNVNDIKKLYNSYFNKVFSTSFLSSDDFKPFRSYGVIMSCESDDILGGSKFDLASGFDKNLEDFGVYALKNQKEIFTYYPNILKKNLNINNSLYKLLDTERLKENSALKNLVRLLQKRIGATERIDGRRYNEFFVTNPIITGMFVYGDVNKLPFEFRKYAQENDLKILHIKTREKFLKNIAL